MRRFLSILMISIALFGSVAALSGCVVVAPRHARVWVPGYWGPTHVWVGGYYR